MSDVRITFDSPREFRQRGKSYWIEDSDGSEIQLPVSATKLETSHGCVVSATIPDYIAEDRGLIETPPVVAETDSMERHDWFLLGATMACLIRGDNERDAVWNGRKIASSVLED